MIPRRFFMEEWLARYKDTCRYNLGESGMPDMTIGELLDRCGETPNSLSGLFLKDYNTRGTERLRSAISSTYNGTVPLENITVTTGTSEALFILFSLLLEKRKTAVVPFPSFQALYEVPRALGANIRMYHLTQENGFIPDTDEICCAIDDSTGVVVINNPHNPSGVLFPGEVFKTVCKKAGSHGAVVLSDEHYRFLPVNGEAPMASYANPKGNVIATGSITKCFGMIGLRMGWIASLEILIKKICDFRDYLTHTLSPVSDFLAAIALEHAADFMARNRAVISENRQSLIDFVQATPGLSLVSPEAGIVTFPRYDYPIGTDDFAQGLIREHGVFVLPGSAFEVEKHFRINLGQEPSHFQEALSRIHEYCLMLARIL